MAAELVAGVPNEITVGFIGVVSAIVGAGAAGVAGWFTTRAQLKHDREQREREREFTLRRDVFLEFAEASTKPLLYLAKITNSEVPFSDLATLQQDALGPAAKMHGVARLSTVRALLTAFDTFSDAIFTLLPKRVALEKFTHQINAIAAQIDHAQHEETNFSNTIHSLSRLPQPDPGRIDDLITVLNNVRRQHADLSEQRARSVLERSKLQLEMAATAQAMTGEYSKVLARLNVAMREEIALPMDEGYEAMVMQFQKRVDARQAKFIEHLSKELADLGKLADATVEAMSPKK